MVGIIFSNAVELFYGEVLIRENIIDPQRWRQTTECPADAKTFFEKCILHTPSYFKIGVGSRDIIQVAAKQYRVRAITQDFTYNIGLDAAVHEAFPDLGKNRPRVVKQAVLHILDLPDPPVITFSQLD